jgi:hypothetical protein
MQKGQNNPKRMPKKEILAYCRKEKHPNHLGRWGGVMVSGQIYKPFLVLLCLLDADF